MVKKATRAPTRTRERSAERERRVTTQRSGRVPRLMIAVALVAAFSYANTLSNGFALDDIRAIVENPLIRDLGNVGEVFRTNYWGAGIPGVTGIDPGLYRPLTVLTYLLTYQVWGLEPGAYHAMNVVLHAAASVLVFVVALDILGSVAAGLAVAAIFAVHPIHTDAVASVVGRAEVLATLFFLLALWLARRARRGESESAPATRKPLGVVSAALIVGVLYFLGLLAKETAVTLPALMLLDDWLHRDELLRSHGTTMRVLAVRYVPLGVGLLAYLALRSHAVGTHAEWLGFVGVSTGQRILTASRVLLEYVALFVFPRVLRADYWTADVPIAHSLFEPLVLASVVVWIAIAVLAATRMRRDRPFLLSVGWFFITILPVSNIFISIGVAKAERILYLPSVGLCLLVGWGYLKLASGARATWIPATAVAAIILALGLRTLRRNIDWKDNLTLALATLEASPRSPLMNAVAGKEYANRGDLERATRYSEVVVQETPNVAQGHLQLGKLFLDRGFMARGVTEYQEALRLDPSNVEAHNNLGVIFLRTQQPDSAIPHFQASARANPNNAEPHINLGIVYSGVNRLPEAETELATALRLNPNSVEAHINLGTVYLSAKRLDDALTQFKTAVDLNPKGPEAHNNLGYVYLEKGQLAEAISQFRTALGLKPDYANARANLDRALKRQAASPRG